MQLLYFNKLYIYICHNLNDIIIKSIYYYAIKKYSHLVSYIHDLEL